MVMKGQALLHALKVIFYLEKPNSQTTQAERLCLQKYVSGKKRLVEIGMYEGLTTAVIARAMKPNAEFYAIDPFIKGRFGV
jgi:predicted O-methyltransferase YrrM